MRVQTAVLSLVGAAASSVATESPNVSIGCQVLQTSLGGWLFFSSSSVYNYEAANFWPNTELMAPGCVFRPQSSAQLANGIEVLANANAEFAVRGGSHMGIRVSFAAFLFCWVSPVLTVAGLEQYR